MTRLELLALNVNYSSWSLRPRILLDFYEIPYELTMYYKDDKSEGPRSYKQLLKVSPTAKLPALKLHIGEKLVTIPDSMAIIETLAELFPQHAIWPTDFVRRAECRAVCAEMHSSFAGIREQFSMNIAVPRTEIKRYPPDGLVEISKETERDIGRICTVWQECRERVEAETFIRDEGFLFGQFSAADAMYAPVVFRFNTYYDLELLPPAARAYIDRCLQHPIYQRIAQEALAERREHVILEYEALYH